MKHTNHLIVLGLAAGVLAGCGDSKGGKAEAKNDSTAVVAPKDSVPAAETVAYQKESTDEATAAKLKTFLQETFKKDLPALTPADRKFSFYAIDLNDDNTNEYFIGLQGTYFCGSGGCTFLLLDDNMKTINKFTVMRGPVFRSATTTDGWHDLIVLGQKTDQKTTYRHLKWNKAKKQYPSNPSVIAESDVAPVGNDFTMWDDGMGKAKEFEF